jgi:hypothetical protein
MRKSQQVSNPQGSSFYVPEKCLGVNIYHIGYQARIDSFLSQNPCQRPF